MATSFNNENMNKYPHDSKVCHSIRACIDRVIELAPDKSIFVESGVYQGNTTKEFISRLLKSGKQFRYYCIDNFLLENVREKNEDNLGFFKKNVDKYLAHIDIVHSDSLEAVSLFEDDYIYFCFLDDNHTYDHMMKQIPLWIPKMKDFSILAGDDFYSDGIKRAVYHYFDKSDVVNLNNNAGFAIENPKEKFHENNR